MAKIPTIVPVSDLRQDAARVLNRCQKIGQAARHHSARTGDGRIDESRSVRAVGSRSRDSATAGPW